MKKTLIIFILSLFIGIQVYSQELYCQVQINTQQVQGTDKKVFETLRSAVFEFMNQRKWTEYKYSNEERIECTMLINITRRNSSDDFSAELNMALKRPVFNSTYNSTLLNYVDKDFRFTYVEYQPLDFIENTHTSNLTSVLAYYAYIFIGLDFDSFVQSGGNPYFEKAESIVNAAQGSGEIGWKSFDSQQNRFWLVANLMNPTHSNIRKFMYEYHRMGMDVMYSDNVKGRAAMLKAVNYLVEVKNNYPNLFFLQLIMDAKSDEFINVFSEATSSEKTRAMNALKKLDPANASKYDEIMN